MRATISVAALYNYQPALFSDLKVPAGMSKDVLITRIMWETMNLECAYPQPDTLREYIGFWSTTRLPIWQKLWDTTQYEYDPIYNYDRKEERTWTESRDRKDSDNVDRTNSHSDTLNHTQNDTTDRTQTGKESLDGTHDKTTWEQGKETATGKHDKTQWEQVAESSSTHGTSSENGETSGTSSKDVDSTTDTHSTETSDTTGQTDDETNATKDISRSGYNASTYSPVEHETNDQIYTSTVTGKIDKTGDVKTTVTSGESGKTSGTSTTSGSTNTTGSKTVTTNGTENEVINDSKDATTNGTEKEVINDDTTKEEKENIATSINYTDDSSGKIDETSARKFVSDEDIGHHETLRAYGNIGVTTTQQMIEQEREIVQFDIYGYIVEDFKAEFCLGVY